MELNVLFISFYKQEVTKGLLTGKYLYLYVRKENGSIGATRL